MNVKKSSLVNEIAYMLENQKINIQGYQLTLLQVIIFGSAIVQLIASFLPMVSVNVFGYKVGMSYFEGHGLIGLALVVITSVCVYLHSRPIALGTSIANICLIIYDCFLGGAETYGLVKVSIGGYLLIVASLVIVSICTISFIHHKNK